VSFADLADWVGAIVVVDTHSSFVYIGRLERVGTDMLVVAEVDVHDTTEGRATKELYAIEAKKHGVKVNRREVRVAARVVLSVSRLDDVITF